VPTYSQFVWLLFILGFRTALLGSCLKVMFANIVVFYTEACKMSETNINSSDFAENRFLKKLLKTTNTDIGKYSQDQFGFK